MKNRLFNTIKDRNLKPHKEFLSAPTDITLNVTRKCNLKCRHCYISGGNALPNELKTEEIFNLLDQLEKLNVFMICIAGGEPLLREDIFSIIKYAKNKKFSVSLSTNGTLINENSIGLLVESGVDLVQVSLDGSNSRVNDFIRGKDAFNKTIKGVKLLTSQNIPTSIGSIIATHNLLDIKNIIKLAKDLGCQFVHFGPVQPSSLGRKGCYLLNPLQEKNLFSKTIKWLLKEREKRTDIAISISGLRFAFFPLEENTVMEMIKNLNYTDVCFINCEAGKTKCVIDSDGSVYGCVLLMENKFLEGNIRHIKFNEIWRNKFKLFRERNFLKIPECKNCDLLLMCQGGCPAISYFYYKDINRADPNCPLIKTK